MLEEGDVPYQRHCNAAFTPYAEVAEITAIPSPVIYQSNAGRLFHAEYRSSGLDLNLNWKI